MPRTRWIIAGVLFVTLVTALVKPMRGPATSPPIVPAQTNFSALIARLLDGDADAHRVAQEAGVRLDAPAFPDRLSRLCADASADFGLRVCAARLLVRAYGLAGYGLRVDSTASAPFWERRETLGLIPKAPAPSGAVPRSAVGPLLVATLEETPFWPAADGADRISRRLAATRDTALTSYLLGQVRAPGRRQAALGVTLARMGHPEGRAWLLSAVRGQRFRGGALVAEALKEGLRDGPPWARLRSAELLARLGDPSGVDALRSLVSNATPDAPTLALNAADVIADLGLTSVIPALRASASRQGGYGLSVIASALSRLGDEAGVRTLIDTALARPESRAAGVYMAGRWGRIDLRPFLADPDTVVRFYATEAMKEQGLGVRGQGAGKAKAGIRYQVSGVRDSSLPDTRRPTPLFTRA
ncbi:MAG: hypothetical protein EXS64_11930 [Candidatus Latescibacteria bacterium]|nr:hypothetical protein [Candidatus Latescibacterota bacterium]